MRKWSKVLRVVASGIILALLILGALASPVAAQVQFFIDPATGPVSSIINIFGSVFTANSIVYIFFNYTNLTATGVLITAAGEFPLGTYITVPVVGVTPGVTYPIYIRTSNIFSAGALLASASFTVSSEPVLSINPITDFIGKTVTVSGSSFAFSRAVTIYFDNTQVGTAQTGSTGTFSGAVITVPESAYGAHVIKAIDAASNYGTATFSTRQSITITPTSGMVGDKVTVKGNGFRASRDISITYQGTAVTTTPSTTTTDTKGTFTATFVVPGGGAASSKVAVSDGAYTAEASFTTSFTMSADKTTGPIDTEVTVTGKGFQPRKNLSITWDGKSVADAPTDETGSFSYKLKVPPSGSGVHKIGASDSAGNSKTADFTVTFTASFNQSQGMGGSKVTATGTGFLASANMTITFDGKSVATGTSDATGNFTREFLVPAIAKGTYKMEVSDGTNKKTADYTVITDVSTNKTTGNIGSDVTITGVGFNGTVTIKYDTATVTTVTAAANGEFTATFKVPVSTGGPHIIVATDGVNTLQKTFTMETEAPPVPTPVLPPNAEKAEALTTLDWAEVSDPSGVTYHLQLAMEPTFSSIIVEKKDLKVTEYTLTQAEKLAPTRQETPYYWRVKAIDGASNESAWSPPKTFYVGGGPLTPAGGSGGFQLPTWAKYLLLAVGALIIGIIGFLIGRRAAYSY